MGKLDIIQWTKKSSTSLRDKQPVTACFGQYPKVYTANKLIYKAVIVGDDFEAPEIGVLKARRFRPGTERYWQGELDLNRYASQVATSFTDNTLAARLEVVDEYLAPVHRHTNWDKVCLKMKPRYFRQLSKFEMVLVEELVRDLKQFQNDKVLEAFSHHTYSESNGESLLYAFKGNRTKEGRYLLLTPEMLTHKYDIYKWFQKHTCNDICGKYRRPVESNKPEKPNNTDIQPDKSFYNLKNDLQPPSYYDEMPKDPSNNSGNKLNNMETTFGAKSCDGSYSVVTAVVHSDSLGKGKAAPHEKDIKSLSSGEKREHSGKVKHGIIDHSDDAYNVIPVSTDFTEIGITRNVATPNAPKEEFEEYPVENNRFLKSERYCENQENIAPFSNCNDNTLVESSTLVVRPNYPYSETPVHDTKSSDEENMSVDRGEPVPFGGDTLDGELNSNIFDGYQTMIIHHVDDVKKEPVHPTTKQIKETEDKEDATALPIFSQIKGEKPTIETELKFGSRPVTAKDSGIENELNFERQPVTDEDPTVETKLQFKSQPDKVSDNDSEVETELKLESQPVTDEDSTIGTKWKFERSPVTCEYPTSKTELKFENPLESDKDSTSETELKFESQPVTNKEAHTQPQIKELQVYSKDKWQVVEARCPLAEPDDVNLDQKLKTKNIPKDKVNVHIVSENSGPYEEIKPKVLNVEDNENSFYMNVSVITDDKQQSCNVSTGGESFTPPVAEVIPGPTLRSPSRNEMKSENRPSEAMSESSVDKAQTLPNKPSESIKLKDKESESWFSLEMFQKHYILQESPATNNASSTIILTNDHEDTPKISSNTDITSETDSCDECHSDEANYNYSKDLQTAESQKANDESENKDINGMDGSNNSKNDVLLLCNNGIYENSETESNRNLQQEPKTVKDDVTSPCLENYPPTENTYLKFSSPDDVVSNDENQDFLVKYNLHNFVDKSDSRKADVNTPLNICDYESISDYAPKLQTEIKMEESDPVPQQRPLQSSLRSGKKKQKGKSVKFADDLDNYKCINFFQQSEMGNITSKLPFTTNVVTTPQVLANEKRFEPLPPPAPAPDQNWQSYIPCECCANESVTGRD